MSFKLLYITNEPNVVKNIIEVGDIRLFVDAEHLGKTQRQKHVNAHASDHDIKDTARVKAAAKDKEVMTRINPVHEQTISEVDLAIENKAGMVMLPMFTTVKEVEIFINAVKSRAKTCLLFETAASLARMDSILSVDGIDEVYIGLNDMSISMGLSFLFEVLSGGLIDYMAEKINRRGIPWGFGGLARLGQGIIPAEMILAEHVRLGSSRVILSQAFRSSIAAEGLFDFDIQKEMRDILSLEKKMHNWSQEQLRENAKELAKRVECFVQSR